MYWRFRFNQQNSSKDFRPSLKICRRNCSPFCSVFSISMLRARQEAHTAVLLESNSIKAKTAYSCEVALSFLRIHIYRDPTISRLRRKVHPRSGHNVDNKFTSFFTLISGVPWSIVRNIHLGQVIEPSYALDLGSDAAVPRQGLSLASVRGIRSQGLTRGSLAYNRLGGLVYPAATVGVVYSRKTHRYQQICFFHLFSFVARW